MIEVRYYSRGGNTKKLAEAIAEATGVEAKTIDEPINEVTDTLFIGGALYAYGLDKKLNAYLDTLEKEKVKKAVVFSTSWISKHAMSLIERKLKDKGIEVCEDRIYARGNPSEKAIAAAKEISSKYKE